MKLLDSIASCGFGSWYDIAKYLPGRTAKECEKHYFKVFIGGAAAAAGLPGTRDPPDAYSRAAPYKHVVCNLPPRPSVLSAAYNEISGYMAARGDFVTEYDNHAELIVKDVTFADIDSVHAGDNSLWFRDLSLAMVDIYRYRVFERERRKRIVRDYGLLNCHATDMYFAVLLKRLDQRTVEVLRKSMRLFDPEEFMKYIEGLKLEMKLKNHISRLADYRREGLTRIHHIKIYERLKARRADTKRKRTSLVTCINQLQDQETWKRYKLKNAIADKIATGVALPHPALARRQPGPLQIQGLPGYDKLTADEKELCAVARLVPDGYIQFKNILINECKKEGCVKLARARALIKIDVNKTRKIYDFLVKQNIVNKDAL